MFWHSINFLYYSATLISRLTKGCPRQDGPPCRSFALKFGKFLSAAKPSRSYKDPIFFKVQKKYYTTRDKGHHSSEKYKGYSDIVSISEYPIRQRFARTFCYSLSLFKFMLQLDLQPECWVSRNPEKSVDDPCDPSEKLCIRGNMGNCVW